MLGGGGGAPPMPGGGGGGPPGGPPRWGGGASPNSAISDMYSLSIFLWSVPTEALLPEVASIALPFQPGYTLQLGGRQGEDEVKITNTQHSMDDERRQGD